LFLLDCGEGAQQQLRRAHLSIVKISALLLSHIHGDHIFGVFPLLSTMGMLGRKAPLDIYAPAAFANHLRFFLAWHGEGLGFEPVLHPLEMQGPEEIFQTKNVRVTAFPLDHKIETFGFRFDERYGARKAADPLFRPSSYAYCSDTRPFPALAQYIQGVRVLYHEATYPCEMQDKAEERYPPTPADAARAALAAGAEKLLVGHYSSRIRDFEGYLAECRAIFPETSAVSDMDIYEF
jgi:ribonuclease Z